MMMQLACSCCRQISAVTIKGIDKTDGTTVWEYGPGSYWRHHYGADVISGVVPNLSATLNKYAIGAGAYPTYNATGNRNTATLAANCAEALTVTKLNSLDGTVIESATLTGFFCDVIGSTFVGMMTGLSITNAAALSGGDYVIVGERLPFIEFVDYSSNTVNKEYILHAHGQQAGNVYLKTRTSSETITIPYNSTAAAVETLFEATADCISATATGGPWPLLPISIDVEWSVSGGDISHIAATASYTATSDFGTDDWDINLTFVPGGFEEFLMDVLSVSIGSQWSFEFDGGGAVYTYTSTTTDIAAFISALAADMNAFKTAQGGDGFWSTASISDIAGVQLRVEYDYEIRILRVSVVGATPTESARRAGSCAAVYDTGTGEMTSAVGYFFGYSDDRPPLKMFTESAALPGTTGLNVLGIACIGSGPDNAVVVTPATRNSGDSTKANVIEKWDIASGAWSFDWQVYANATMAVQEIIPCESGYVLCPIYAKRFDGARDRTAAKIAVSGGAITEVETTFGSITAPDNNVLTMMYDDTPGSYMSWAYHIWYQDQYVTNNRFRINGHGADTWLNGTEFRLGATPFGTDGSSVFAQRAQAITGGWNYDGIGDDTDSNLFFKFFATHTARAAEPQQFRFVFRNMPFAVNYTDWLDWYSTQSEIETALNALLGSGNCAIIDFGGEADPVENNPLALIECNPMIRFRTDRGFSPGTGYIPYSYFAFRSGDGQLLEGVTIEMQNLTPFTYPTGIASYSATTADLNWSRPWGTVGATTIAEPLFAWLQGDYVYAYGNIVDSEL